jgi:serine/threonine protein kinase
MVILKDVKPAIGEVKDFYVIGPTVGVGAFGEVISLIHKKTRQIRCVKKVLKRNKWDESVSDIRKEIMILKHLNNSNILKFHEYFEDRKHFYIVTDFCRGGALYDEIHYRGKFEEQDAAVLIKSLLQGLSHCH